MLAKICGPGEGPGVLLFINLDGPWLLLGWCSVVVMVVAAVDRALRVRAAEAPPCRSRLSCRDDSVSIRCVLCNASMLGVFCVLCDVFCGVVCHGRRVLLWPPSCLWGLAVWGVGRIFDTCACKILSTFVRGVGVVYVWYGKWAGRWLVALLGMATGFFQLSIRCGGCWYEQK